MEFLAYMKYRLPIIILVHGHADPLGHQKNFPSHPQNALSNGMSLQAEVLLQLKVNLSLLTLLPLLTLLIVCISCFYSLLHFSIFYPPRD